MYFFSALFTPSCSIGSADSLSPAVSLHNNNYNYEEVGLIQNNIILNKRCTHLTTIG
jgi:hypothetical protein